MVELSPLEKRELINETTDRRIPALFVSYSRFMEPGGGGVQVCNRDYVAALEAAGFKLRSVCFDFRSGIIDRLSRRVLPEVWHTKEPKGLFKDIQRELDESNADYIFFAHTMFSALSQKLKRLFPRLQQVFLSHGAEGFDFCIEQQIRRQTGTENRTRIVAERMVGSSFLEQMEQRCWVDAVLTLSPAEVEIEKWLGSPKVLWVPRTIADHSLDLQPVGRRVGCVSTLDHAPNYQGLVKLFEALEPKVPGDFRFRLVGHPPDRGVALSRRFPFVEYLGSLSDAQLRTEAATWCCFVHPMFLYAKGCSTKLAVALAWGLPVATTEFGARGYAWDAQRLPLATSPNELAALVLDRSERKNFEKFRAETVSIVELTPTFSEVGAKIRGFLIN